MIKEVVKISDYYKIAKEHKIFLWHFLRRDQCNSGCLAFFSYFDHPTGHKKNHLLKRTIDVLQIPYFESYTEDSIDFLIDNGIPHGNIWSDKSKVFTPIILGFHNGVMKSHTGRHCYCETGVYSVIADIDISILEKLID